MKSWSIMSWTVINQILNYHLASLHQASTWVVPRGLESPLLPSLLSARWCSAPTHLLSFPSHQVSPSQGNKELPTNQSQCKCEAHVLPLVSCLWFVKTRDTCTSLCPIFVYKRISISRVLIAWGRRNVKTRVDVIWLHKDWWSRPRYAYIHTN